jgi:hypothetical protein
MLAQRLALSHPLPVIAGGFILDLEVELPHILRFSIERTYSAAEIIVVFRNRNNEGVPALFVRMFFKFARDIPALAALRHL